jgi:hypothetical protein
MFRGLVANAVYSSNSGSASGSTAAMGFREFKGRPPRGPRGISGTNGTRCICRIWYGVSKDDGAIVDTKLARGAVAHALAPFVNPVPTTQGLDVSPPTYAPNNASKVEYAIR